MADNLTEAAGVLWTQAKEQLSQQSADLDALRTRAVALLSVSALVGGLFGSQFAHRHMTALRTAGLAGALALFAVSVLLAVAIGWPRKAWEFGMELDKVSAEVSAGKVTLGVVNISLTNAAASSWRANASRLKILYWLFSALCLTVGLQVVAWALALL
jgi:hypothetical protein